MNENSKLVIIIGSVREGRFGPVVASWVADRAREHGGFDVDVVDLADVDLPLALPAVSPKYAGDTYPRPDGDAGTDGPARTPPTRSSWSRPSTTTATRRR